MQDEVQKWLEKKLYPIIEKGYADNVPTETIIAQIIDISHQAMQREVVEAEERVALPLIEERDFAEEWADRLAYAKFGIDEIGERSNVNNPWENALELLELEQQRQKGGEEQDASNT